MKNARKPIGFIATSNPFEAKRFYGEALGLELFEESSFALVFNDGEIMLRIQIVPELSPVAYTVHGWQIDEIEQEIETLGSKGIEFLQFDQMEQSSSGIWTSPGGHKIAWFKDPCGNILSLTQFVELDH